MEQYIPKSALVAGIERIRAKWFGVNNDFAYGQKGALTDVLSFIDTLEVKDLELTWKDMECIIKHYQYIMAEKSRVFVRVEDYQELLKRFKAQKGNSV